MTLLVADDAVEVRTDLVGAALLEGVAGAALLRDRLTLLGAGGGQQHFDRLALLRLGSTATGGFFLHRDVEAGLLRLVLGEHRSRGDIDRQQSQAGAEHGAHDLVEFKRVHRQRSEAGKCAENRGAGEPGRSGQIPGLPCLWQPVYPQRPATFVQRPPRHHAWLFPPFFRDFRHESGHELVPHRHPDSRPHGLDPPAGQAADRHRRGADDRPGAAPGT